MPPQRYSDSALLDFTTSLAIYFGALIIEYHNASRNLKEPEEGHFKS